MGREVLSVSLAARPSASSRARLTIEQKGWRPYTGYVTAANAVAFLGRMLYGDQTENGWQESASCGFEGTDMVTGIYAYPWPANTPYQMAATYGLLSEGVREEIEQEEVLQFTLEDEASTRYPALRIVEAEVRGDLYDRNGGIVTLPPLTIGEDRIILPVRVYGSIRVKYLVARDTYILTVPRRDPGITVENFYSSVVYGWGDGFGDWLTVEAPPGADEFAADSCGWTRSGSVSGPEDSYNTPTAAGADRYIRIDYCTREVRSDTTYES